MSSRIPDPTRKSFRIFLIKPSHYDDDGYPIQWIRSDVPSNSMAVLNSLAIDCQARRVLGDDVDIEVTTIDEIHSRVRPERIARQIKANGGKGMVALVAVQSNQYPRALDIAKRVRESDVPVCIGGFHVSGTLSMIRDTQPEIQDAWDHGISLFAGEAEGRFDVLLRDAYEGELKPLYNYLSALPDLNGAPVPVTPVDSIKRNERNMTSVDTSRGCPFQCSFCTIINVQGRKTRSRAAEDVERAVREHYARGVNAYFISDDNFARNRQWEPILDRLIHLREAEGMNLRLCIQVDTLSHRIPGFIEKARRAGTAYVFIGLENINPDNLLAAKKKQNRVHEFRDMLQQWKSIGAIVLCGYIIGFEYDTPERVLKDIDTLKRELPIDVAEFFCLTPLPGSEDHKVLYEKGAWLEPDLNKYDTEHICAEHARMSAEAWHDTYRRAWESFYSYEHIETVIRRTAASGGEVGMTAVNLLFIRACQLIEGIHPMQGGLFRRKYRRDRRPGLPLESPFVFYPRYFGEVAWKTVQLLALGTQIGRIYWRVMRDPRQHEYRDIALTPVDAEDLQGPEQTLPISSAAE